MAANQETQSRTREVVGKGLETGGIIGAIIGLAALNLEVILFSAAAWYGGKKIEGKKRRE